jgi:CheY-like chemotaxis protein
MSPPGLPVLIAEDEESDAVILRFAFQRAGLAHQLFVVRDGQAAIDYLVGSAPYDDRQEYPLPKLLLLDLKMPRMNGFDVLAWLTLQPQFHDLPAVVLSSSAAQADVAKARQMGAREYFVKPHGLTELVGIVEALHNRWLNLPPHT